MCASHLRSVTPEQEAENFGSFTCVSGDNGNSWGEPHKAPYALAMDRLNWPMSLLYVGKDINKKETGGANYIYKSVDEGKTWIKDIVLTDVAPHPDLGFPCSTELADGSIYTVYYQHLMHNGKLDDKCSIVGTKWCLDDILEKITAISEGRFLQCAFNSRKQKLC